MKNKDDDLISRQAAIDTIGKEPDYDDGMVFEALSHAQRDVALLPAVDAVPVVHGEWVWVQYDANPEIGNFHCSKCRFIPAAFNMAKRYLNYCPNCGAKMDGKDGE